MASLILGIVGKKRSGKDTLAAHLIAEHGFTRLAFADALKNSMCDLNPWVRIEHDETGLIYGPGNVAGTAYLPLTEVITRVGWEKAKEIREVRRLLQSHGVAMRDHVDPDLWVNVVHVKADKVDGPVVITDVRFPNEIEAVEHAGGYTVRVKRPQTETNDQHVSETILDGVYTDFFILNDTDTTEHLHTVADDIIAEIRDTLALSL